MKRGRTAPLAASSGKTGELAPPVRESAAARSTLTVTRQALLVDGSDLLFRELIQNLLIMSHRIQELRSVLAKQLGVTEPQYRVFLTVAQQQGEQGVSVSNVAKALHVTGALVTREAGKLLSRGYIVKKDDPDDGRGVLLSLTEQGRALFAGFAPVSQAINDELFADLTTAEFQALCAIARRLVTSAERTILLSRAAATPALHDGRFKGVNGARSPVGKPIDGMSARATRMERDTSR